MFLFLKETSKGRPMQNRFCKCRVQVSVFRCQQENGWFTARCAFLKPEHRTLKPALTGRRRAPQGFTLLELLLAVALLATITTVTFMAFSVVTTAWRRGQAMTENLHHADYVLEQIVAGLRSAYYPDVSGGHALYGFQLEDDGDGDRAADSISWVKLGSALVGDGVDYAASPHRVKLSLIEEGGERLLAVRAWRLLAQMDDFDPEDIEYIAISDRVMALDIQVAYERIDDEIDWLNEWEHTNRVPTVVELAVYMKPTQDGERPQEIRRIVGIPVAGLSWR